MKMNNIESTNSGTGKSSKLNRVIKHVSLLMVGVLVGIHMF